MPTAEPSPLAEAVARVGDRWSLLIVQALLSGTRRFNELLDELSGIAPNVLSQRLKHLEREALVVSRPYSRRPPRFAYELSACSPSGAAQRGGGGEAVRHEECGTPLEARWYCPTCARTVEDDEAGDLHYI